MKGKDWLQLTNFTISRSWKKHIFSFGSVCVAPSPSVSHTFRCDISYVVPMCTVHGVLVCIGVRAGRYIIAMWEKWKSFSFIVCIAIKAIKIWWQESNKTKKNMKEEEGEEEKREKKHTSTYEKTNSKLLRRSTCSVGLVYLATTVHHVPWANAMICDIYALIESCNSWMWMAMQMAQRTPIVVHSHKTSQPIRRSNINRIIVQMIIFTGPWACNCLLKLRSQHFRQFIEKSNHIAVQPPKCASFSDFKHLIICWPLLLLLFF